MKTRYFACLILALAILMAAVLFSGCGKTPPTPAVPESKVENFANSKNGLKRALKENYVDFSFDYPKNWDYKMETGEVGARNFVRLERSLPDTSKGVFTLENFAVGWLKLKSPQARNPKSLAVLAADQARQLAAKWPAFKIVSEGPVKINKYAG
jgi:hypothetical protein